MPKRIGRYTLALSNRPCILASATAVGKKEAEGPRGALFDKVYEDGKCAKDAWEEAESELQRAALAEALRKAGLEPSALDMLFAGDLLNQCLSSAVHASNLLLPYIGLYGACSTMAESLALASCFVEGGLASRCAALTSSHFCASERQFRFPLEYGSQRPASAQWTATASGAAIVGRGEGPCVSAVTFGKIVDFGVKDANNMGGAMAPAAADTLATFFQDTGSRPADFDLVLTGDLGAVGSELLHTLMEERGFPLGTVHDDCGLRLYDRKAQEVEAGGSGCGCSAAIVCGEIIPMLRERKLRRVLFAATGALMSLTSAQQRMSIPGIAHAVLLESE